MFHLGESMNEMSMCPYASPVSAGKLDGTRACADIIKLQLFVSDSPLCPGSRCLISGVLFLSSLHTPREEGR